MQQMTQTTESNGAEHKRLEAVVETLAVVRSKGETLEEVAHDARNMVTALGLYCDLLEEPGVLDTEHLHYGGELRLVAAASRRLVEKLVALDTRDTARGNSPDLLHVTNGISPATGTGGSSSAAATDHDGMEDSRSWELPPSGPIQSFAGELAANRNLLAALAGPSISLIVKNEGGALPVDLTGEDVTRVLVNLVKNAAEAMPKGGHIRLELHEFHVSAGAAPWLILTVEDNGPGILPAALDKVFESGYTSHSKGPLSSGRWPVHHGGLGLSIIRSIVGAAGGTIRAGNRDSGGARFVIELPVRTD
jgi:signal transduction histidine kinase